MTENGQSI